jgi:hypothetical protein
MVKPLPAQPKVKFKAFNSDIPHIFILNPVIKKSVNSRGEISLFPDFPQNYRGQSSNP